MLFKLRSLQNNTEVDDSDYIHALQDVKLDSYCFAEIESNDLTRLKCINKALDYVLKQRAVPVNLMRCALDGEEFAEYTQSFDTDITHAETNNENNGSMPTVLVDYMEYVRRGDRYTRISNLFKKKQRVKNAMGVTAYSKYDALAESCYEDALMLLTNAMETDTRRTPLVDYKLIADIARWIDRDVDTRPGYEPEISQQFVPRIKGSKSKFSLAYAKPVVGEKLRKYWRQRNALVDAALPLLYPQTELTPAEIAHHQAKIMELQNKMENLKQLAML